MMMDQHNLDLGSPVLAKAMDRDGLVRLLTATLDGWYPRERRKQGKADRGTHGPASKQIRRTQVRYNAFRSSIGKFDQFLADSQISEVTIDENLIQRFQEHLVRSGTPVSYLKNHRNQIRKLINALPAEHRQRELVSLARFRRAHKWDNFSPETPRILADFVKNGRKLKNGSSRQTPELSGVMLSEPYREQIIKETLTFLRAIQAPDILQVTADDVEEFIEYYDGDGKKHVAIGILDYIRPLFTNLLAKGLIKSDPLIDVPKRERRENLDYVDQVGIDKLADLTTVDMNCFKDVRDRVLAFSIYYDFALRNREGSLIKTGDLKLDTITSLVLPKGIQKVQREDSLLFSYFPNVTRPLLERYLQLRAKRSPTTDILIVTDDGLPVYADGCREAVRGHCDKLGVKTFDKKIPTPHRLRHSFGTLNCYPLGRGLDIVEIKEQYRHSSIDTTYRLYFAKNPILKKCRYEARMRTIDTGGGAGRHSHDAALTHAMAMPPPTPLPVPVPVPQDNFIAENEALRQVRGLGLNYRALRQYGLKVGKVRANGRGHDYSASFITDLASNYFTRKEAMDFLGMARATFFDWTKADGVDFIQIGQVGLFRKDLILLKKRAS